MAHFGPSDQSLYCSYCSHLRLRCIDVLDRRPGAALGVESGLGFGICDVTISDGEKEVVLQFSLKFDMISPQRYFSNLSAQSSFANGMTLLALQTGFYFSQCLIQQLDVDMTRKFIVQETTG